MLKMFHYMKERWHYILMIIVLLFIQAFCDLSLPDYTSKIVNVGIQQKGIEDCVPETIREASMKELFPAHNLRCLLLNTHIDNFRCIIRQRQIAKRPE